MTEMDAINDLHSFEYERRDWLLANKGSEAGFKSSYGKVVSNYAGTLPVMSEHLQIPYSLQTICMSDVNRSCLGTSLNVNIMPELPVDSGAVEFAREYVSELYKVDLDQVVVVLAPQRVMSSDKLGHVYSCRISEHVIVMPQESFDPKGVAVMLFAQAAHYTLMRKKGGLAAMITDKLTFAMSSLYALGSLFMDVSGYDGFDQHLQNLVVWEFGKGLALTPKDPLRFIASDLGTSLMKVYGTDFFKDVVQHLYDSATGGQAMVFASNHFNGAVLAFGLLGREDGMRDLMAADAGGVSLRDKLADAFGVRTDQDYLDLGKVFNDFVGASTGDVYKIKPASESVMPEQAIA